jgi:hypothetical protein
MSKTPYQQFVERNNGGPAFREPRSKQMKASKLIEILAKHIGDDEGGDFEVCISHNVSGNMAEFDYDRAIRCWLYPDMQVIIIGDK